MAGIQAHLIQTPEPASMDPAAWSSIFGRPTLSLKLSLLILALSQHQRSAKAKSAVTTHLAIDSRALETRTVVISLPTDTETTPSTDQEATSMSTPPNHSLSSLSSTLPTRQILERSLRSEESTFKMERPLKLQL